MGKYAAHNKRYIFTMIDAFSKQAFAVTVTQKNEASVLKALEKIYKQIKDKGKSIRVLQTDNGAEFIDAKFEQFCLDNNIKHIISIPGRL